MRKLIITTLTLLSCCLAFLQGCQKDGFESGVGYVTLNISHDESVKVITKADGDPIFKITAVNKEGVTVATIDNHNDLLTNPLKLQPGTYTIKGSTGEPGGDAAFGAPVYTGQTEIVVEQNKTATATIVCTLSQVKVTVKCTEEVTANFKEVIVTVTNQEDFNTVNNLIFSSTDGTINNEGYFTVTGLLNYKVYLVNQDDEVYDGQVTGTISNVQARDHYILTLTLSEGDDSGVASSGIGVDLTTNSKDYDINVNVNKKAKPAFTTSGFDLEGTAFVPQGTNLTWSVDIVAKAGIESLILSHSNSALSALNIPANVNLVDYTNEELNNAGITWSGVTAGTKESMTLDFTSLMAKLELGSYSFKIEALDKQNQYVTQELAFEVVPDIETTTQSADPWGKHAFLYGRYNTVARPAGMGFEYKKASDTEWTKVTDITLQEGTAYYAKVTGLEPRTEYQVRAVSDKEPSNIISFTTLGADQIENMSFDSWCKSGKHIYPNADLTAEHYWWDSGNEGANTLSEINPTQSTTEVAVSGEGKLAARLETKSVLGVLAAGSLFLGDFGAVQGLSGASLSFGRPYNCKPLSLKGYYSYAPAKINIAKAPYESYQGQDDYCSIYVVLADWPSGNFNVNTSTGTFIDFENDPNIIAYGSMENNTNTNGYITFEIPLEYKNNRVPTCAVIVCSSSKYGDYFTGGVGSVMLIDELEFTF